MRQDTRGCLPRYRRNQVDIRHAQVGLVSVPKEGALLLQIELRPPRMTTHRCMLVAALLYRKP